MALLSSIILFSCSKEVYFSGISETSFNEIKENYQNVNYSKEDVIAIIGPPLIKEKSNNLWIYGTDKKITEELLKTRDLLLELDWQGAFNIKEQFNSVKNIFLIPPSYNILRNRLEKRGTESEESITMRLSAAKEEISKYPFYDYLVLNDDFENALTDLKTIILKKTSKQDFKTRVSEKLLKNLLD